MHIITFGGSFDPPHRGHTQIVSYVLQEKIAGEVWYVPCANHPFAKNLSPAHHRLAMLKLVAQPSTKIIEYELQKSTASYSYNTLTYLKEAYPQHHFSWLMGSDQLPTFHKWNNWGTLLKEFPVYVYPRPSYAFKPIYPGIVCLKEMPEIDISSTQVRERLKKQKPISHLVAPAVEEYIQKFCMFIQN